jgi:hypothetical protein
MILVLLNTPKKLEPVLAGLDAPAALKGAAGVVVEPTPVNHGHLVAAPKWSDIL